MEQGLLGEESRLGQQQGGTRSLRQVEAMGGQIWGQIWKKGVAGCAFVVTCMARRKQPHEDPRERCARPMCQAEGTAGAKALRHGSHVLAESPDR